MFIDWITVSQHHGEGTPEYIGGLRFVLDEDGAPAVESGAGRQVKGSFDSSCRVTSHGGWVRFSGNPARWNKPDNLFGMELDSSMAVVNSIMDRCGLPNFTKGLPMDQSARTGADLHAPAWTGAAFSELHLTRNYSAGSDMLARLAIRSYAARSAAYLRKGVHGDESVTWANTRRRVKAYRKGPEMAVHAKSSPYVEWATTGGIVRHEVELKRRLLSETGLRYWGNCDMGTLHNLFDRETAVLRRPDCSLDPMAIEAVEPRVRLTYAAWLRGEDVRSLLPRATFYRHRKSLADCASIDIAEPRVIGGQVVPMVRVVDLTPAAEPAGYWNTYRAA